MKEAILAAYRSPTSTRRASEIESNNARHDAGEQLLATFEKSLENSLEDRDRIFRLLKEK